MNDNIEIMNIGGVDCYEENGTAYLKLETVARGLGFTQIKNNAEYVKWERVNKYLQELNSPQVGKDAFIPENIFYRLAMKAKNEVAEKFQAKIADEVIPSIRKHGAYMTPDTLEKAILNPDTMIQLCQQLKEEQEKRKALEAQVKEDAPKVAFAQAVSVSKNSILVGDFAKLLRQNGIEMGQQRLFQWLRDNGYLIKQKGASWNMPTQKAMEQKLFEIKESVHADGSGNNITTRTAKISGKGQLFFMNKLLERQ